MKTTRSYSAAQLGKLTQALDKLNKRDWPGAIEVCERITANWPEIPEPYEYRAKAWRELEFCCRQLLAFETQRGGDPQILTSLQRRLDECEACRLRDEEESSRLWKEIRGNLPIQK